MTFFRKAAVAATLLAAVSAYADVTATATLSGIRYELFDLDANDGISASISFQQGATNAGSSVYTTPVYQLFSDWGPTHSSVSASSSLTEANNSSADFASNTFYAQASTEVGSGDRAASSAYQFIYFVLGAATGVHWYANSTANNDCPAGYTNCFGHAYSYMVFEPKYPYSSNDLTQTSSNHAYPGQGYSEMNLAATVVNVNRTNSLNVRGEFAAGATMRSTQADEFPAINPVPEPKSCALMLAGLCVMGAIARRRAKA